MTNTNRGSTAIKTEFNGVIYRSQTEARWAVFFDSIDARFKYEPEKIRLSSGENYIPDFFIYDFKAYFEVKPSSDEIVTDECAKARCLTKDRPGQRVWLTIGGPAPRTPNVLPLDQWEHTVSIEDILKSPENRYWFHEDRRDEKVYWLHSEMTHGYEIGGPGKSSQHDRSPLNHRYVAKAYEAAMSAFK